MKSELAFLLALWKANLLAAMEYRAAFFSQVIGMVLNDAAYFVFWVIFFNRFQQVRGWELADMFLLFGLVAASFGLGTYLFGNVLNLAEVITKGQLDYYLSLPRPVLLHVLASRSVMSGLGDLLYGLVSFCLARQFTLDASLRFVLGILLSAVVFLSFLVIVQSATFWLGSAQLLSQQAISALLTFSSYPISLFDNTAKFLLFTLVPAALVGAVPAELVRSFSWERLLLLLGAAFGLLALALFAFSRGLRRYESGSAIQVQM